jgi:hypothetical protein
MDFLAKEEECCFEPGLARNLRKLVSTAADLQAPQVLTMLTHTFGTMPASNIRSEDRFARQSAQQFACHGRSPSIATAAARHVLTESQCWHHVAMEKLVASRAKQGVEQILVPSQPRSAYNLYVKDQRAAGLSYGLGCRILGLGRRQLDL